jgi:hypothetical protein
MTIATRSECIPGKNKPDNKTGYVRVRVGGRAKVLEHRLAWEMANGPIPAGMCVLHACDNRACINVEHLFLGTYQDNALDMVAKGRHGKPESKKTHCPQGHAYSEENTWLDKKRNARHCRECMRQRQQLKRLAK